jgi:hypothetical protein
MRMWRSGSASPCQGEGREFESRHPLECQDQSSRLVTACGQPHAVAWPRGEAAACKAVHTGSNPVATSNTHKPHTSKDVQRAIGAAVARFPDTEEVTGSIPVSPTIKPPDQDPGVFCLRQAATFSSRGLRRGSTVTRDRITCDRAGSIPVSPTIKPPDQDPGVFCLRQAATFSSRGLRRGSTVTRDRITCDRAGSIPVSPTDKPPD